MKKKVLKNNFQKCSTWHEKREKNTNKKTLKSEATTKDMSTQSSQLKTHTWC